MLKKLTIISALAAVGCMCLLAGDEITKTNLPVTITSHVVTNIVEGNNQKGCATCEGIRKNNWLLYHPPHGNYEPWQDATERWAITNVVRRITLATEWQGKPLTYSEETTLSSVTNRWKLTHEWKQD